MLLKLVSSTNLVLLYKSEELVGSVFIIPLGQTVALELKQNQVRQVVCFKIAKSRQNHIA